MNKHTLRWLSTALLSALLVACGGASRSADELRPAATPNAPTTNAASPPVTSQTVNAAPPTAPTPVVAEPLAAMPIASMLRAELVGKRGVPVDVHYQLAGEMTTNQPTMLQIALVPRVAGSNLQMELKTPPRLRVEANAPQAIQKATAAQAYRQSMALTPLEAGIDEVRVLVSMEHVGGSSFGIFRIPLTAATANQTPAKKRPPQ
jgi:hypothetical protein